jgi:hypothetical protein
MKAYLSNLCSGAPRWRDAKPPDDVVAAENESAEMVCRAYGQPRPSVTWYVNGLPLTGFFALLFETS